MRYMIAHMLSGDARAYHENLSKVLASFYRLRPVTSNIDPHLTVKAPFDALSTDMHDVERIVDRFVRVRGPLPYTLKGFGNFDDRVVYMNVDAPDETYSFMKDLREELREVPWLEFKPHEQDLKLHATLCYPRTSEQTNEIVAKLTEKGGREFSGTIGSVAILRRGERHWEIHKEFKLNSAENDPLFAVQPDIVI